MKTTASSLATVCIAFKEPVYAQLIYNWLKGKKGISTVVVHHNSQSLLQFAQSNSNITLLLDQDLPGIFGIPGVKNIVNSVAPQKTVLFCNDTDHHSLHQLVQLNYHSYFLKSNTCDTIKNGLNIILKGIEFHDKAISRLLSQNQNSTSQTSSLYADKAANPYSIFTARHLDIIKLLHQNIRPGIIHLKLGISKSTYTDHRKEMARRVKEKAFLNLKDFLLKNPYH